MPSLCDVEVAAVLRRLSLAGSLTRERQDEAVLDYVDLPITRHGHVSLMTRVLGLRDNFSAYDATYVALTEQLDGALLTSDRRLVRAVTLHTSLEVL